jgi:hypothetical protein
VRTFRDLAPYGDAAGAIQYLAASQASISEVLRNMDDNGLNELRPTHFGESWPAHRVLSVLIDEQVHHGAEVALLRDLHRSLG